MKMRNLSGFRSQPSSLHSSKYHSFWPKKSPESNIRAIRSVLTDERFLVRKSSKQLIAEKRAAFEGVVSEYEGRLLRYAARILWDYGAAQDTVQDTFIKLFRSWKEELTPSPNLSSWLYRVTHNGAVDLLRKRQRRRLLHSKEAEMSGHFVAPNRGDGFRGSAASDSAGAALKMLSLREQQLVVLKIYEEKSYKEISQITGITVSNVGYILHHAMKKMAEELKKARSI